MAALLFAWIGGTLNLPHDAVRPAMVGLCHGLEVPESSMDSLAFQRAKHAVPELDACLDGGARRLLGFA